MLLRLQLAGQIVKDTAEEVARKFSLPRRWDEAKTVRNKS